MPTNPPQIAYQPWYNLIVAKQHLGTLSLTPKLLVEAIRTQLDPHGHGFIPAGAFDASKVALPFRLQFRVHSVRAWNLTGRTLALAIDDFSVRNASDQEQICGLVDCGTALHVPACGFKIPASLSNIVLRNDNDDADDTIVHVIAPSGNTCMTYVEVSWRFDGPIKVPTFATEMQKLLGSTNVIKKSTTTLQEDVSTLTGIVRNQMNKGYIDTVINGISKVAEVVAVAGAEDANVSLSRLTASIDQLNLSLNRSNLNESVSSFSLLERLDECAVEDLEEDGPIT